MGGTRVNEAEWKGKMGGELILFFLLDPGTTGACFRVSHGRWCGGEQAPRQERKKKGTGGNRGTRTKRDNWGVSALGEAHERHVQEAAV